MQVKKLNTKAKNREQKGDDSKTNIWLRLVRNDTRLYTKFCEKIAELERGNIGPSILNPTEFYPSPLITFLL